MKDFIAIGDNKYRVEVNWNTISDFLDLRGRKLSDMQGFADFSAGDINALLWCAVLEGERLEGRDCEISQKDLTADIGPDDIRIFLELFQRHFVAKANGDASAEAGEGSKKKTRWSSSK